MDRIILTGLREEKGADKAIFHESCLILLCRFWSAPLAAEAAASVRRLLLSHKAHQAVLAAAAWCVAECYPRNSDRRLFAPFLQAPPSEYDDSLELRPGKYVYVVHGDDEQETAPVTPRDWEDAVSAARLGGEEKKSKSVLCVLFRMLFHPTSVALIERGLAALLNLCSDPETNRHVREKYYEDVLKIPETLTTGPATHIIAVSTKKFELLLLLSQIDLVEDSLFRLRDEESRRKFRKAVLRWRRFLGYKALSDVKEQFDEETLRKLQATFGEIDEDGSGYISGEELGGFFKNVLKMPLTKKELAEIIEEVDIDGNGCIDFEEFLLVVKNMKSMHKVQSRLGVVLEKKSKSLFEGVTLGSLVAFRAKKRAEKMKDDFAKTREKKQYDHDAHVEADAAKRHRISQRYKLSRLEMRRRWDRCAKETYSAVVKKNAGHVTLNSVLSLLRESPHLLEGLGFVAHKDDKGLRAVSTSPPYKATLFAKYAETCDVGAELGTYHDFEMALWRVARSHREKEEDRNFGNVA